MPLTKAKITVEHTGEEIPVMFNPEEYTLAKDNNFASQTIPGNILGNLVTRLSIGRDLDMDGACGKGLIHFYAADRQAKLLQLVERLVTKFIPANTRNQQRFGAERKRVIGEIGGSASQLPSTRQQVPQQLTDADKSRIHTR